MFSISRKLGKPEGPRLALVAFGGGVDLDKDRDAVADIRILMMNVPIRFSASILGMACQARALDSNVTTFTTSVIFLSTPPTVFGEVSIVLSKKS